ncbi:MAG: glycosyltransferase [Acuticoccus sp.]
MRVLIWVQHLLGTGHTVRAAAIAQALKARGARVTLALGARPPAAADLAGLDILPLHPVGATDGSFRVIIDEAGASYESVAGTRRDTLLHHLATTGADAFLTETFPFGRRRFVGELLPVLAAARAGGARTFASIRDVLVRKPAAKAAAMADLARAHYDGVLVHADPRFVELGDSFPPAAQIGDLLHYTGFVDARPPVAPAGAARQGVVVSAGGSNVGAGLVEAAIAAAALGDKGHGWRILVPPALADRLAAWQAAAGPNVTLEPNRPDFRQLLAGAALSVSQAGYNTVLDVLDAGPRMVFVPFAAHEETEQDDRAAALARRGLATVVPEGTLTPGALAAAVREALAGPLPGAVDFDRAGAAASAALILAPR